MRARANKGFSVTPTVLSVFIGALLLGGCAGLGNSTTTSAGYRVLTVQRQSGMDDPEAWYQLGRYFFGQGRTAQAENALRRALALQPAHAEAHNILGALLAGRGALAEAEGEFRSAVQLAPGEVHLRANLGRLLALQGRDEAALVALEDAALVDPDSVNVRTSLAALRQRLGREPSAPVVLPVPPRQELAQSVPSSVTKSRPSTLVPLTAGESRAPTPMRLLEMPPGAAVPAANGVVVLRYAAPEARGQPARTAMGATGSTKAAIAPIVPRVVVPVPAPVQVPEQAQASVQALPVSARSEGADASERAEAGALSGRPPRLEVANGNGVEGMARRVRAAFVAAGHARVRVTNLPAYTQVSTVLEYRAGFAGEARRLGAQLSPLTPLVLYEARLDARADLRLVLGRDLPRDYARDGQLAFVASPEALRLAGTP